MPGQTKREAFVDLLLFKRSARRVVVMISENMSPRDPPFFYFSGEYIEKPSQIVGVFYQMTAAVISAEHDEVRICPVKQFAHARKRARVIIGGLLYVRHHKHTKHAVRRKSEARFSAFVRHFLLRSDSGAVRSRVMRCGAPPILN